MRILHLTLKKKFFDMIASGEKKEEYRLNKPYWRNRLIIDGTHPSIFHEYDRIIFKNGYSKDCPQMEVEVKHLLLTFGKPEWGGDANNIQFVFRLGKILSIKNYNHVKI